MHKRRNIILFILFEATLIAIMLILYFTNFSRAESLQNEDNTEMPYVILGGFGVYTDYTQESFFYFEHKDETSYTDKAICDDTIVQFGKYPILSKKDLDFAFSTHKNSNIVAKRIIDHKLYSYSFFDKFEFNTITEENFVRNSDTCAKACFLDPNTNFGLCFAHPISAGKIAGNIFKGEVDMDYYEESPENIYLKKSPVENPKLVGTITNQLYCGVVFKYDDDYFPEDEYKKIQIAQNKEVELGKAYIYTDYGKGLNMYEVEIVDLTGEANSYDTYTNEPFYSGDSFPFDSKEKLSYSLNKTFGFVLTDERLINDGITCIIGGMSGSPIIQNDKLIGFSYLVNLSLNKAFYAQSAYEEVLKSSKKNEASYEVKLSDTNHPLVYAGVYPVTYYTKGVGAIVTKSNNPNILIGDTILTIDDVTFYNYYSLNETIEKAKESGKSQVELSILRNDKILEIPIDTSKDRFESYDHFYLRRGAISMIDPISNRYSAGAVKDVVADFKPFSGISIKCYLKIDRSGTSLITTNDVCGTIDDAGYTVYGFLEPYNKDDECLVEIANKNEVQNGEAVIILFSGDTELYPIHKEYVTLECEANRISFKPSEYYVHRHPFDEALLKGAPVYQNGRLVGVFYRTKDDDKNIGYAYYAIDVYNEMMNLK